MKAAIHYIFKFLSFFPDCLKSSSTSLPDTKKHLRIYQINLISGVLTPVVFGIGCVYFSACPHVRLAHKFISQEESIAAQYSQQIIGIITVIGVITMSISSLEVQRIIMLDVGIGYCFQLFWKRTTHFLEQMSTFYTQPSCWVAICYYREMMVVMSIGRELFGTLQGAVYFAFFLIIAVFNYITIGLYSQIPLAIYGMAPYFSVGFSMAVVTLMNSGIRLNDTSTEFLRSLNACKYSIGKSNRYMRKVVKSLRPLCLDISFMGHRFMTIDQDSKTGYFCGVLDYTINLLLSFP